MLKEASGIKKIVLRCGRTDLRKGIDGLKSIVSLHYGLDPMEEGTLFLFCGTRADRFKGLLWEGEAISALSLQARSYRARASFWDDPEKARVMSVPSARRMIFSI